MIIAGLNYHPYCPYWLWVPESPPLSLMNSLGLGSCLQTEALYILFTMCAYNI